MRNKSRKSNTLNKNLKNTAKRSNKDDWRDALDSISINDDYWWCTVTMLVETIVEHSRYISLFCEAVEDTEQACIYSLSYQKTIDTVRTLSKQDPEKCPVIESICHYANTVLSENNGHLSTWLIARLIKYLIYRAKIEHIGRLKVQTDLDREIAEECRAIRNTDSSTSSRSTTEPRRTHSSETEATFNGKVNIHLHVANVAFDGPKLYIVLSGFHNPDLPAELLSVGVPLTCIFKIKLPGEQYVVQRCETEGQDTTIRDETHFFKDRRASETVLREFWRITRERFADLPAHPTYSNVIILPIHPPVFLETIDVAERESLKRDVYDGILLALHHLYDLCRRHAEYLNGMKLEEGIVDERDEAIDTRIYEDTLSDIPNEYVDVPLILSAILLQVEHNLATTSSDEHFSVDRDTGSGDTGHGSTSTTAERSPVLDMQAKLRLLDLEYELTDEYDASQSSRPSALEVIPYGDTLGMIVRQFLDGRPARHLEDAVLRVLRDPRLINVWRDHRAPPSEKSDVYLCHMDNIARAFNREQTVSREEVAHYLHLLAFDRLIFPEGSREAGAQSSGDKSSELKRARSAAKGARSVPNFTSPITASPGSRRSKSDSEIDHRNLAVAFTECAPLFALVDARETLLPGYLRDNVFAKRSYERSSLEEYEDVELLSSRVFLQVAHECFQTFDRYATKYFEPTDSMLLYFSDDNAVGEVSVASCLSSIRTPIGLHEFCEYIATEEVNRMEREQETRQSRGADLTGRFMKRPGDVEDDAIIFDDECFVLPDSLKARHLRKGTDRENGQKKIFEMREEFEEAATIVEGKKVTAQKRNEAPMANNGGERADGRVMSGKTSMTGKKSDAKIDDVDTSLLTAKKILSQSVEMGDSVGYDLGGLRVQVIHHKEKFLLDGDTSVRVVHEDWLHRGRDLRIAVTLPRCTLRLSGEVGRRQSADTFHLTTKRGIVLGFQRNGRELVENSSDSHWRNLTFDFRASCPSGLLIEPNVGSGTKNPFCIRQSYVSKRPRRAGAAREVCRNFLRNGTVLKYLDDNTVVIFHPNGVIVTCMDFDKPQSRDESIHGASPKKFRKGNSRQSVVAEHSGEVVDSTETRSDGESIAAVQPSKQHVAPAGGLVTSKGDDSLIRGAFAASEVLRYLVVNYDGRCYEMLNDLVVSEHDRLLVRTTSDYEVNEVFTHRADGTDTLLRSNGELIVTFPDGTSIITGYMIEEQPVICEWTENELWRYFGVTETKDYGDRAKFAPFSDNEFSREDSSVPHVRRQVETSRILSITDGFVSILLTFRMEHKDYATVSYDQSAVSCTLSMPDNLHISISRRGHYEVSIGDEVNLKVSDDDVAFWKTCATCGGRSMSTYKFPESYGAGSQTILTTSDILGNVLEVESDGTTRYHRREDQHIRKGRECNGDVLEHGEERRRSYEEGDANSEPKIHCKHERYCETLKFPARSQYRIFAMNRDLTACEYLHRSVRCEQEVAAVFGDEMSMSMIQYPISRRPELHRLITFVPVKPELRSKEISCQYRVMSDKRTDYDRIELPRSTYSFAYDWLFPFGKKVVSERTRNEVLAKRNEQPLPKLLRVRVFFGIKGADRSVLIDMQRAMGRYWLSVLRDSDKCRLFYATGSSRPCEVENDYRSSEDGLRELALGVKGNIDVETYVRSLRGKLIKVSTKASRQSSRLAELLRQRGSMKKVYEWYKQCMRKRIIVPYFENIDDSCYFLMKNPVDEEVSKKSHSRKKEGLIDRNEESCRSFH